MKNVRKIQILILCFLFMIGPVLSGINTKAAGTPTINATEVKLYGLNSDYSDVLSIPASYAQEYQLVVKNAEKVTYSASGACVVDSNGKISPRTTTWYWYGGFGMTSPQVGTEPTRIEVRVNIGSGTVRVNADGVIFDVAVEVVDYSDEYVEKSIEDYLSEKIRPYMATMTDMELMKAIAAYPASFDYSAYYYTAKNMIIFKGGDCWASCDLITKTCDKLGIESWIRNGNKDPLSGSGHRNVVVSYKGKYYELEAGYSGRAPRIYNVKERTTLYSYYAYSDKTAKIYQYDAKTVPTTLTVPEVIDGYTVTGIGDSAFSGKGFEKVLLPDTITEIGEFAFSGCTSLKSINIPAKVSSIGEGAFSGCDKLTGLTVGTGSLNFVVKDGVLYSKDMKTLVSCHAKETLVIPASVTTIAGYAIYNNGNLVSISGGAGLKELGEGAIAINGALKWIDLSDAGTVDFGPYAFAQNYALRYVKMPKSVSTIGYNAFQRDYELKGVFFYGDAPKFLTAEGREDETFTSVSGATIYYPKGSNTWTASVMTEHGGSNISNTAWETCKGLDISKSEVVVGHTFSASVIWNSDYTASAKLVCKYDSKMVQIPSSSLSYSAKITVAPTTTAEGKKTHTVSFTYEGVNYSQSKTEVLPPTGVKAPVIKVQPKNMTAKTGTVRFVVSAEGEGLTYQWYWRKNASSEWAVNGFTGNKTSALTVEVISARNGFQYRCVVKDKYGRSVTSNAATLYYADQVKITKQPITVKQTGGTAKFTVGAVGDGLTYQWYWRKNSSAEWGVNGLTGNKTATLSVDVIEARNGFEYRCVVKDKYGNSVTSGTAVLYVGTVFQIIANPVDAFAKQGNVTFHVNASGTGLTYQWYWRRNASYAWGACGFTGCKTDTMTVEAISARNGFQYRCMVKDKSGKVLYTKEATLHFGEKVKLVSNPASVTVKAGTTAKFTVKATGDGLTYQWYWRRSAAYEWEVNGSTGCKTATLSIDAIAARNGFEYRCVVKDKYGNIVTSGAAVLKVE